MGIKEFRDMGQWVYENMGLGLSSGFLGSGVFWYRVPGFRFKG